MHECYLIGEKESEGEKHRQMANGKRERLPTVVAVDEISNPPQNAPHNG